MNPQDFMFRGRTGELLIKLPGSINGNGFVLDKLHNCEVYILDHTSQVQVDDCIDCKIFIGPTDGSVFLRDCSGCTLCVAARQLRTRDCRDLDIALYCATQPSIETSVALTFSCWRGAYPGLTEHFARARLDPAKNTWSKVYDFNAKDDLGGPHYTLDESVRPWWVPPLPQPGSNGGASADPAAPPDCPVAAADGSLFGGGRLEAPPMSPAGSPLPDSLPPSPGRAAAHDEEVELSDEEEAEAGGEQAGVEANAAAEGGPGSPREPPPVLMQLPLGGSDHWTDMVAPTAQAAGEALSAPDASNPFLDDGTPGSGAAGAQAQAQAEAPTAEAATPPAAQPADNLFFDEVAPSTAGPAAATSGALDADFFSDAPAALLPPPPSTLPAAAADDSASPANAGDFFAGDTSSVAAQPPNGDPAAPLPAPVDSVPPPPPPPAATPSSALIPDPHADARVAWRSGNATQLAAAAREEGSAKAALREEARRRLESLQQTRAALLRQRYATNRETEKATGGGQGAASAAAAAAGGSGTQWARVLSLVDLTASSAAAGAANGGGKAAGRSAGGGPSRDVTRLRQLMIALKSRPLPARGQGQAA